MYHNFEVDRIIPPLLKAQEYAEEHELPFILWWTPFTGEKGKLKKCFSGECFFSTNRQLYNHNATKAILFYGSDFNEKDLPLPRKSMQYLLLLCIINRSFLTIFYKFFD